MAYLPSKALHPGLMLQKVLNNSDMTQRNLSARTGLTEKHISQIINGEANLTVDTALLLENVLGGTASFWINLDKNYQETQARLEREQQLEKEIILLKNFPYGDLVNCKYVEQTRKPKERVRNLWKFFGVNSLDFVSNIEAVAYRRKDGAGVKSEALATWLRCGEIEAAKLDLVAYNRQALKSLLSDVRKLTRRVDSKVFADLTAMLAEVGVGLVCVPHFAHTQVNGATRWMRQNPVIQLSIRGRDADKFWFTLFHELGHIINHGRKEEFIEFINDEKNQKEIDADAFAQKTLIPSAPYGVFVRRQDYSAAAIEVFAETIQVDPGIVLGRLKHDGYVEFAQLSYMHSKLMWMPD